MNQIPNQPSILKSLMEILGISSLMVFMNSYSPISFNSGSGSFGMDEVESMLLLSQPSGLADRYYDQFWLKPELRVRIEHLQGAGRWGLVGFVLDLTSLRVRNISMKTALFYFMNLF